MIKTGYPFYGQDVGVLVFSTTTPRIPGDAGNAGSFAYPVCYQVVKGGFADLIEGSAEIRQNLLEAVEALKQKGVGAILGDCGLMSLYQQELPAESGLVTAASSLCQIPLVWQLIGRQGTIGILTGHSRLLGEAHLRASGHTAGIPLAVQGMEEEPHFSEIVIEGGHGLDPARMEQDVRCAARKLTRAHPGVRAIIIECSNLATFSWCVGEETGLPVFDLMGAANLLRHSVAPPRYPGAT